MKKPPFLRRPLVIVCLVLAGLGLLGVAAAGVAWATVCSGKSCPSLSGLEQYQPRQTSRLFAADGRFIAEIGQERRTLVRLDQIPPHVRDAFLVVEDKRFYSHHGIDPVRAFGAAWVNFRAGHVVEGFSTITMQLARGDKRTYVVVDKAGEIHALARQIAGVKTRHCGFSGSRCAGENAVQ